MGITTSSQTDPSPGRRLGISMGWSLVPTRLVRSVTGLTGLTTKDAATGGHGLVTTRTITFVSLVAGSTVGLTAVEGSRIFITA